MNNQSGQPEKGSTRLISPGSAIIDFQHPRLGPTISSHLESKAINLVAEGHHPANIIEGLFTSDPDTDTQARGLSREEILDIALHRAKKAA